MLTLSCLSFPLMTGIMDLSKNKNHGFVETTGIIDKRRVHRQRVVSMFPRCRFHRRRLFHQLSTRRRNPSTLFPFHKPTKHSHYFPSLMSLDESSGKTRSMSTQLRQRRRSVPIERTSKIWSLKLKFNRGWNEIFKSSEGD